MVKFNMLFKVLIGLLLLLVVLNSALMPVFAATEGTEQPEATTTDSAESAESVTAETDATDPEEEQSMTATTTASGGSVQFSVAPVYPENQQNRNLGYFDILVKSGTTQNLQLMVSNRSNEKKVFSVGGVSASTTPSGVVDYTTPDVKDETLTHPFSEMIKIEEEQFALDAQTERIINIPLTIPKESFDGIVLGGLRVTDITDRLKREQEEEDSEDLSMSLYNEYEHVIGVVLQETEKKITPNFELGEVYLGTDNYRASIMAEIRNTEPTLIKNYIYSASVKPEGSETKIFSVNEADVSFAPNSVMTYAFSDELGLGIDPGNYQFTGSLTNGDQVWDFSKTFTIEKEAAKVVNEKAGNQQQKAAPTVNIAVLAVVAVLVIAVAVLIVVLLRRKRY